MKMGNVDFGQRNGFVNLRQQARNNRGHALQTE